MYTSQSKRKSQGQCSLTLNFFIASISPDSLFRHLKTTPYAPSPTTPKTSYLFMLERVYAQVNVEIEFFPAKMWPVYFLFCNKTDKFNSHGLINTLQSSMSQKKRLHSRRNNFKNSAACKADCKFISWLTVIFGTLEIVIILSILQKLTSRKSSLLRAFANKIFQKKLMSRGIALKPIW